jgi:hypothetical protein
VAQSTVRYRRIRPLWKTRRPWSRFPPPSPRRTPLTPPTSMPPSVTLYDLLADTSAKADLFDPSSPPLNCVRLHQLCAPASSPWLYRPEY